MIILYNSVYNTWLYGLLDFLMISVGVADGINSDYF